MDIFSHIFLNTNILCVLLETSINKHIVKPIKKNTKVMFGNRFCFLFSKSCFWEYKEKIIFLYFLNKKHV